MTNVVNNYNVTGDKIDLNDGKWHGWNGGDCPVHPNSVVEIVYTRMNGTKQEAIYASSCGTNVEWENCGYCDIVAFRVTEPYTELKAIKTISLLGWHDGVMDDELYEMTFKDADGVKYVVVREVLND